MNDNGEERGANPTLLKKDIDQGLTGDKVSYPDPAASPLGTDDEAAGTPVTQTQLDMARQAEGAQAGPRDVDFGASPGRSGRASMIMIAVAAAIVLLLLAAVL